MSEPERREQEAGDDMGEGQASGTRHRALSTFTSEHPGE